jgi:hypothetical protein
MQITLSKHVDAYKGIGEITRSFHDALGKANDENVCPPDFVSPKLNPQQFQLECYRIAIEQPSDRKSWGQLHKNLSVNEPIKKILETLRQLALKDPSFMKFLASCPHKTVKAFHLSALKEQQALRASNENPGEDSNGQVPAREAVISGVDEAENADAPSQLEHTITAPSGDSTDLTSTGVQPQENSLPAPSSGTSLTSLIQGGPTGDSCSSDVNPGDSSNGQVPEEVTLGRDNHESEEAGALFDGTAGATADSLADLLSTAVLAKSKTELAVLLDIFSLYLHRLGFSRH